jgi:hypothetical protein
MELTMHLHPIQLFDSESSTYTSLLAAPGGSEAVITVSNWKISIKAMHAGKTM